jgi:autotransporter strand-loop-strand O-heptosyltransferase
MPDQTVPPANVSAPASAAPPPTSAPPTGGPPSPTAAATPDAGSGSGAPQEPVKRAFPAPADMPTQAGPKGVKFDFNDGCRLVVAEDKAPWKVRLKDLDTGNILFETTFNAGRVNSSKRYYVRFGIELLQEDKVVFTHEYSAANREVVIQFPIGTLGDTLGWLPYAIKFQEKHKCRLTCAMAEWLIPLFKDAYPNVNFITHEQVTPDKYYATYNLGLFFDDKDCIFQPTDFRHVGLHRTAGYILGVDPTEVPPRIALKDEGRPFPERYVVIAAQSTTQSKYWNNPNGWREIVQFLKDAGYRVICIDQKATHGHGLIWNHIPYGAEDFTGDRPLLERARFMKHAEFFIGLSSGLSWLAWAMQVPVVMISGFTLPDNEFATPYRIINYHTCNGCWNDPAHRFDHKDFLWCPRHKDTPRQFECTRFITAEHVRNVLKTIPGFGAKEKAAQPAAA